MSRRIQDLTDEELELLKERHRKAYALVCEEQAIREARRKSERECNRMDLESASPAR